MSTVTGTVTVGSSVFPVSAPITLPSTGAPFLPYGAGSYYQSPASSQPVDTALTSSFRQFMATFPAQAGTLFPIIKGVGGNLFGTPYALGQASDPIWTLTGTIDPKAAILTTQGFHAPSWLGTALTGTSDSPVCVQDIASGFTVFATKVSQTGPATINVTGSAGLTYHSSNGLDYRNPLTNDIRNETSRGRISDAMVIRKSAIDYGIANGTGLGHVLHMFMVETLSSAGFQNPMIGNESGKNGWGAEGQRLAIDPSIDLTTRGLSPAGLVVARTLQIHGCYIGDNAGGGSTLKAEQETTAHPVWNGELTANSLQGITWNDFIALQHT